MTGVEREHEQAVKVGRLEWLADTMTTLHAREVADPGSVDALAVYALASSVRSWSALLRLDVPA